MTQSVHKNRGFTGMVPPAPPARSPYADRYKASDMAKDRYARADKEVDAGSWFSLPGVGFMFKA